MTGRLVAVTGASGQQGRAICRGLANDGWQVRALSRSESSPDAQIEGAERVWRLNRYDLPALEEAFRGVDTVVLNAPVDYRPGVREGLAQIVGDAALRAGVAQIILNTGAEAFEGYPRRISQSLLAMREILSKSSVAISVVQPTVFMENLLGPAIASGVAAGRFVYPVPPKAPIAWISHRGLGQAVAAAADRAEAGALYRIGGPAALTGTEVAEQLSAALGRRVRHVPMKPDDFARLLPPDVAEHIADYYRRLGDAPHALARNDGNRLLALQPESFGEWARTQDWAACANRRAA